MAGPGEEHVVLALTVVDPTPKNVILELLWYPVLVVGQNTIVV